MQETSRWAPGSSGAFGTVDTLPQPAPRVPVPLAKACLSSEPRTCSLEGSGGGRGVARCLLS